MSVIKKAQSMAVSGEAGDAEMAYISEIVVFDPAVLTVTWLQRFISSNLGRQCIQAGLDADTPFELVGSESISAFGLSHESQSLHHPISDHLHGISLSRRHRG